MKGLYFYKLVSPYHEDVTKDCKLTVNEIDHNFITLKNSDIQDITFNEENGRLTLTQINGEELFATIDLQHFPKDFSVEWNKDTLELIIRYNDKEIKFNEFISTIVDESLKNNYDNILDFINIDNTLIGKTSGKNTLGINPLELPGTYKAVNSLINKVDGEFLPYEGSLEKGDRFLSYEQVSVYGNLYNFDGVKKINEDLKGGWRVPSKDDWDDMLNSIELCDIDKNHHSKICNVDAGKVSGKLLKSKNYWEVNTNESTVACDSGCMVCGDDEPLYNPIETNGVDAYNFTVLPAGYGDGYKNIDYANQQTQFWTLTETERTDVYVKRFYYNKSNIVQIATAPIALCSVRLIKDYDGKNFYGFETINGEVYNTVLMPSQTAKFGYTVWTSMNVAFDNERYNPQVPKVKEGEAIKYVYYINEWDGFKWLKKQLVNGDSLIILTGPDGENNCEYQLIDGELINIKHYFKNEMLSVANDLITIQEKQGQDIESLQTQITEHKEIALNALSALTEADIVINNNINIINDNITALSATIETNKNEAIIELNRLNQNAQIVDENITAISGDVNSLIEQVDENEEVITVVARQLANYINVNSETIASVSGDVKVLAAMSQDYQDETDIILSGLTQSAITANNEISIANDNIQININDIATISGKVTNNISNINTINNSVTSINNQLETVTTKLDRVDNFVYNLGKLKQNQEGTAWQNMLRGAALLANNKSVGMIVFELDDDYDRNKIGVIEQQIGKTQTMQTLKWDNCESIRYILFDNENKTTPLNAQEDFTHFRTQPTTLWYDSANKQLSFRQKGPKDTYIQGVDRQLNFGTANLPNADENTYSVVKLSANYQQNNDNTALTLRGAHNLYNQLTIDIQNIDVDYNERSEKIVFANGDNVKEISLLTQSQDEQNQNVNAELVKVALQPLNSKTIKHTSEKSNSGTSLSSEVILSQDNTNILQITDDGIYAKFNVEYDKVSNKLTFVTTNGSQDITLSDHSLMEHAYYDSTKREIVLIVKNDNGINDEIRIGVNELFNQFNVENSNDSPIILNKITNEKTGVDTLSASLRISNATDNLIQVRQDGSITNIYARGNADAIALDWIVLAEDGQTRIHETITVQEGFIRMQDYFEHHEFIRAELQKRVDELETALQNQIDALTERINKLTDFGYTDKNA